METIASSVPPGVVIGAGEGAGSRAGRAALPSIDARGVELELRRKATRGIREKALVRGLSLGVADDFNIDRGGVVGSGMSIVSFSSSVRANSSEN